MKKDIRSMSIPDGFQLLWPNTITKPEDKYLRMDACNGDRWVPLPRMWQGMCISVCPVVVVREESWRGEANAG